MGDLIRINGNGPANVAKVRRLEAEVRKYPQVKLAFQHTLHGGLYVRTVFVPAGVLLTGALIKVATVVIVQGDTQVYVEEGSVRLEGYNVLPASAGRKQAFLAITDVYISMMFPTRATTVEQAEREFTDEDLAPGLDVLHITGE